MGSKVSKNSFNILIVDDEEITCETLKMLLHRNEYNVISRNSAIEAFDCIKTSLPDLILLDVMMPNMDGFTACKQIKSNLEWKHIPVILITALEGKENLIRGLESGADEFLSKPVNGPELRARVRSMLRIKEQYDELEENMKMREYLSHMIMHDIRNPLLSIALMCELSMNNIKNNDNNDRRFYKEFEDIKKEAKQLNSFINDMLLVTKLESGKLVINWKSVDIDNLVRKTIHNHEIIAKQRRINISIDINETCFKEFMFDENLIMQVLDNLISNAIKFSQDNSKIIIKVEKCNNINTTTNRQIMRLQVIDEGEGISSDNKEKIFNKFETIKMNRRKVLQTGFGLAFCQMVVKAHNGKLYVKNNKPKGSIFTMEI